MFVKKKKRVINAENLGTIDLRVPKTFSHGWYNSTIPGLGSIIYELWPISKKKQIPPSKIGMIKILD